MEAAAGGNSIGAGRRAALLPVDEIASQYEDGATIRQLANAYGCSKDTIRTLLVQQGVERRQRGGSRLALPADEVISRYRAGESMAQLARSYGVNDMTILRLLEKHGEERRPVRSTKESLPAGEVVSRYRAGETLAEIADAYGTSATTIREFLISHGVERRPTWQQPTALSDDQADEIVSRYRAGETLAQLADAYGVSRATVTKALDRRGEKRRRRGPEPDPLPVGRRSRGGRKRRTS